MRAATPIKRFGELDEFAALAEHCVENEYLNGTTIRFDGGLRLPIVPADTIGRLTGKTD